MVSRPEPETFSHDTLTTNASHCTSARKASFAPRLEALDDRLVPSVAFTENTATHVLTVNAAAGQNNAVAIVNDGNGNLTVTADGTTRNFTGIVAVQVRTHDGADNDHSFRGKSSAGFVPTGTPSFNGFRGVTRPCPVRAGAGCRQHPRRAR